MSPLDADTLVVGSGPHGLATCAYLLSERPRTAGGLLVIDPQGWMAQWNRQLRDLGVERLRSSCVHHPDPDPWALVGFADEQLRRAEMTGQFNVPSTSLFADFCSRLVERLGLEEALIPLRATRLRSDGGGAAVQLEDRSWLRARGVVLATNPSVPRLPPWSRSLVAAAPAGRVVHSDEVQLDGGSLEGERRARRRRRAHPRRRRPRHPRPRHLAARGRPAPIAGAAVGGWAFHERANRSWRGCTPRAHHRTMSSTQKVVIVTGASQGIGEALVTAYGKLGYAVVATHRPRRQCVARPRGHHATPRPG